MINTIISLIVAVIPSYLILLYIYNKDKDKESKALLVKLFIAGISASIPALVIEVLCGLAFGDMETLNKMALIFYVLFGIALVEEACKFFFVYKISYNHKEFDHIYDALVYSVFVSLGFATFENIFYVFEYGIGSGIVRAISSIPGHACFAIIMGNYLGIAKIAYINGKKELSIKNLLLSLILPTLIHGLYDYCLFSESNILYFIFVMLVVVIYIYSFKVIKKLSNVASNFIENK